MIAAGRDLGTRRRPGTERRKVSEGLLVPVTRGTAGSPRDEFREGQMARAARVVEPAPPARGAGPAVLKGVSI